jgi:hypothetical protein
MNKPYTHQTQAGWFTVLIFKMQRDETTERLAFN